MAMNRFATQKLLDALVKALDERIADDRHINLQITGDGFRINCIGNRRFVLIRPAVKDNHLVFEFGDDSTSWQQNVMCVWSGLIPDLGARCVDKWFAVDDGFLFNVPTNGIIPPHSVSRIDGKQVRGPVKE